jgi:UDP-2,3-diacylglucosamine hydrolase
VLPSPCYVISDAHLGVAGRPAELSLVRFLEYARRDAGSLLINGDLFDFWFEWRRTMPRAGYRVLAQVAAFADAGLPVLWMAGNHDCWGGAFIREDVGAQYHEGPWRGEIAGWKSFVHHGDGLRTVEDKRYRALRVLLRNRAAIWAFRNLLHPDWASRLALGSSAASRTYTPQDRGEGLRQIGRSLLEGDAALDLVLLGHSHVAGIEQGRGTGVIANAGTWLGDSTFLRIDETSIQLCRWRGNAVERVAGIGRSARA